MLAVYDSLLSMLVLSALFALGLHHFGASHGVLVAGYAWALAAPILLIVLIGFARTIIVLGLVDLWRSLAAPLGGLALLTALGLLAAVLVPAGTPPAVSLSIRAGLLVAGYIAYLRLALHTRFSDLKAPKASARSSP